MDVDPFRLSVNRGRQTEESRVFALSDTLSVRLAASLPIEVQQAFQVAGESWMRVSFFVLSVCSNADPNKDFFTGSLNLSHGSTAHAVVVSVTTCFVWKIDIVSVSKLATITPSL